LILTGEFDIELEKKMAKERHSELDNSKYFMFEIGGHCVNIDKSLVVNKIVIDFIRGIS
jgi:pimeloyl-ACP methyl ester carboxylesterase